MSSLIKVDQIQLADGSTPTAASLGLNITGSVLQVVYATDITNNITSGTSFVATNLAASITPSYTNSKILITVYGGIDTNTSGRGGYITIYRDGTTNLALSGASGPGFSYQIGHNSRLQSAVACSHLDSPNTTSEVSYRVYIRSTDAGQIEFAGNYQEKGIVLMEIAG